MLRLRSSILAHLLSRPVTSSARSSVQRLLSSAAPRIPPNPSFAVEEYLVGTCGLDRAQALKASARLSHVKSPSNPDAVLAFLAGLGLSGADVAALVAKDPKFLCSGVGRTLEPIRDQLTGLGLSHAEVVRLVSLAPGYFRSRSTVSNLPYYLSLFGSFDNFLRVLKYNAGIFRSSLERVVKPNVTLLRECGLSDCDIPKLCVVTPWLLSTKPERLRVMVACAEGLGVPPGSGMFRTALQAVAFLGEENVAAKLEYLKNTFRWSDAEVRIAVCKAPLVLVRSKDTMQSKSEFLISEVGLEPAYIAHRPVMISCSLEGRLRPRYYVVKFLKENGLLYRDWTYFSTVMATEKVFMEKYICPHKENAPYLAQDYAVACRGEVPTRFRFA